MSNILLQQVRDMEMKGPGRPIMLVLADHADNAGQCWISYNTIARETGFSRSTVLKYAPMLRELGFITWKERFTSCGDKDSNLYTLTLGGSPPHGPPSPPHDLEVVRHTDGGSPPHGPKASIEATKEAEELFPIVSKIEKNPKRKSRATLEEVVAFAKEIGLLESDGAFMFHTWGSNGWTRGGHPVQCWKGQMQAWKIAKYFPSQKFNPQQPAPPAPGTAVVGGRIFKEKP